MTPLKTPSEIKNQIRTAKVSDLTAQLKTGFCTLEFPDDPIVYWIEWDTIEYGIRIEDANLQDYVDENDVLVSEPITDAMMHVENLIKCLELDNGLLFDITQIEDTRVTEELRHCRKLSEFVRNEQWAGVEICTLAHVRIYSIDKLIGEE